ncbi:MAG: metal-dependent hydrolase [Limnobacter sp.]|nr:metal-dependent hydrolase [Limnobacter sp.]
MQSPRDMGHDTIEHRDVKFDFDLSQLKKHWFNNDPWMTHLFNGLFCAVPDGERWVMQSARKQMGKLKDEKSIETVKRFIKQEASHSREHDLVNAIMLNFGVPADKAEKFFKQVRQKVQAVSSDDMQASIAAAIEHFTAVLSEVLLESPDLFDDMDPKIRSLVYWHMVEETEHKAVSHELFEQTVGKGPKQYLMRVTGLVGTFGFGFYAVFFNMFYLLYADKQLGNVASAVRMLKIIGYQPGFVRKILMACVPYLKPGFHPWERDNRALIAVWKETYQRTGDVLQATEEFRATQGKPMALHKRSAGKRQVKSSNPGAQAA